MSRLLHFLDNRFKDGSGVVSHMRWSPFTPRKIPRTHFCYRLSWPQGHSAAGRIRSIEKSNDLIRNWTHDLLACSIEPHATMQSRAPHICAVNMRTGVKTEEYCTVLQHIFDSSSFFITKQTQSHKADLQKNNTGLLAEMVGEVN
jgi:hypothetical protein